MKLAKKLLGLILTLVFVLSLANLDSVVAKAESYTYRVKICIGNNADAHFTSEGIDALKSAYAGRVEYTDGSDELVINGFKYDESVDADVLGLIAIDPNAETGNTKYYVSGLRVSGGDTIVTTQKKDADGNRQVTLNRPVKGDEIYVVAYGVGSTIPYTVKYVDEAGNALLADDTLYAAKGEVVLVPAKHISGYYPDALYRTASDGLKDDTTFTFVYKKYDGSVVTIDDTTVSESTVYGEPVYEYQYRNSGTRTTNGGTTNNRPANGGNGGAGNADANAADGNNANGDNGNGNGEGDGTTIADEETPLDIIDIDDEETAKHGETRKDKLVRKMIICILIAVIAVVSILVALLIAYKKRKGVVAKVEEKKDTKE